MDEGDLAAREERKNGIRKSEYLYHLQTCSLLANAINGES